MRILLLNQFYPPDTAATGQLLADVAEAMARDGHEVHVVCSRGLYGGGKVQMDARRDDLGVAVHRLRAFSFGRGRSLARMLDWGSFYLLALLCSLRLGRFDAVLALTTPPFIGCVGWLMKRLGRTRRLAVWTMDVWPEVAAALGTFRPASLVYRLLLRVARGIDRRADTVISLGEAMTRHLETRGVPGSRVETIENWVPRESVAPVPWGACSPPSLAGEKERFRVMYSGNMGMGHEFRTILEAADLLRDDPAIVFLFVGHGKRREEIAEAVRARGLTNVAMKEPEPLEHLSDLLGAAHVHLVSQRPEVDGLLVPSKIYGILAAARPALFVGSNVCEVAGLLARSGAGWTVPIGDSAALAGYLRRLKADETLARDMGERGRRYYTGRLGRDLSVRAVVRAVTRESNGG